MDTVQDQLLIPALDSPGATDPELPPSKKYEVLLKQYNELMKEYECLRDLAYATSLTSRSSSIGIAGTTADKSESRESIDDCYFVFKLLNFISGLYNNQLYSDIKIQIGGTHGELYGHRFVLEARSSYWSAEFLSGSDTVTLSNGVDSDVALTLVRWLYSSSSLSLTSKSDEFLLELMLEAGKYHLRPLVHRCEKGLEPRTDVSNCIRFYQVACDVQAAHLIDHCSQLINNNWHQFNSADFECLSAPLLYAILKEKSSFPIHRAVESKRDDVLLLSVADFNKQLDVKMNERDDVKGMLPLELGLLIEQESLCDILIKNKADMNTCNRLGESLLHSAVKQGNEFACLYLIKNGADINVKTYADKRTPLHMVSSSNFTSTDHTRYQVTMALINRADCLINSIDYQGSTALHLTVSNRCSDVFEALLCKDSLDLNIENADGLTPLAVYLLHAGSQTNTEPRDADEPTALDGDSMASKLINRGCHLNTANPVTGNTLLHQLCRSNLEDEAVYLAEKGASLDKVNNTGETALHIACELGQLRLVTTLLSLGADPNIQTTGSTDNSDGSGDVEGNSGLTPLHLAISYRQESVVKTLTSYDFSTGVSAKSMALDYTLTDSAGQTALALALWSGYHDLAQILLDSNHIHISQDVNSQGFNLLHQAVIKRDTPTCLFLLKNGFSPLNNSKASGDVPSVLELAVDNHLNGVVSALCSNLSSEALDKVNESVQARNRDTPCLLWKALVSEDWSICDILVKYKCDINCWHTGSCGCLQTLLHRAILEERESAGSYLIANGCDLNCSHHRQQLMGVDHISDEDLECGGRTSMHMASVYGLERIVLKLIEFGADINSRDRTGRTALHLSISSGHRNVTSLLLSHPDINVMIRDGDGWTPFATAMTHKDNRAAQAILDRNNTAADQFDNRGRNLVHVATEEADIENLLFLISVQADINSRMRSGFEYTPLHLAVIHGAEIIVRNLLLAGANINDLTMDGRTCLHLAAELGRADVAAILIENGVDSIAVNSYRNNALHISMEKGSVDMCGLLLTETNINAQAVNMRGDNPLHILARSSKKSNSVAIFDVFMRSLPDYPLNAVDAEGNTALLLAYISGNGPLSQAISQTGRASLGVTNFSGANIFNAPTPSKSLLYQILDNLSVEPPWTDGDICLGCAAKFSIKTRKHHCRHCGRILCSKCSSKDMPIIKYNLNKPVRVCDVCFNILTVGAN